MPGRGCWAGGPWQVGAGELGTDTAVGWQGRGALRGEEARGAGTPSPTPGAVGGAGGGALWGRGERAQRGPQPRLGLSAASSRVSGRAPASRPAWRRGVGTPGPGEGLRRRLSFRTTFKEFAERHGRDRRFRLVQKRKDQEHFFQQFLLLLRKRDKENRLRLRRMR